MLVNAAAAAAESLEQWLDGDYATGTWGGARTQLEEAGITPELAYTTDLMAVTNGNAGSGDGWDYAGRVDAGLDVRSGEACRHVRAQPLRQRRLVVGPDLSERQVGNLFAVQQVFTGRKVRLSQLYLQQELLDDRLTFKVGRLTTEDDFLASDIYTNYVNGGINGVPSNIPDGNAGFTTAPFAQWGVVGAFEPMDEPALAVGVYNADDKVERRQAPRRRFRPRSGRRRARHRRDRLLLEPAGRRGGRKAPASKPTSRRRRPIREDGAAPVPACRGWSRSAPCTKAAIART